MTSRDERHEQLQAIVAADPVQRTGMINEFIRADLGEYQVIARKLCRVNRLDPAEQADDIAQIVAQVAYQEVEKLIAEPSKMAKVTSFLGIVMSYSRAPVRTYADGAAAGTRPSGATALARRQREMARTRYALRADLGRDPSDQEVVDETNERISARLKDPARQAMVCTLEDLQPVSIAYEDDQTRYQVDDTADEVAERDAARGVLDELLDAVAGDPVQVAVAKAWLGGVADPAYGAVRDVNEVAKMVGISSAAAAQAIAGLQVIGQKIITASEYVPPEPSPQVSAEGRCPA